MPVPPGDLSLLLTRAERLLGRRVRVVLDAMGYSPDAWRVLSILSDGAGHHMTQIADHAFLPPATLTKLVDQLVDDNLVYRRIDPIDRRRIRAYLTPRGRAQHERINRAIRAAWDTVGTAEADDDLLAALLTRLVDTLSPDPSMIRASPK
jgi:DNA-binding MarR family transcriptional regulator